MQAESVTQQTAPDGKDMFYLRDKDGNILQVICLCAVCMETRKELGIPEIEQIEVSGAKIPLPT